MVKHRARTVHLKSQYMKRVALLFCSLLIGLPSCYAASHPRITLSQFAIHPALNKTTEGVIHALQERQVISDKTQLKSANANGNVTMAVQIAKHQAALAPRVMVAIATPSAQALLKAKSKETMLAFSAVTDHKAAGLVGENIMGVTDHPPLAELLSLTLKILPTLKIIGVMYHSGEINSVKTVETLEALAKIHSMSVLRAEVTSSANVKLALQKLMGRVDVLYLPQDNAVISALPLIVQETLKNKLPVIHNIPIISNDPTLVNQGVFLALGCDYFKSGVQLGHMIADVLEGKTLSEPIQKAHAKELLINEKSAQILGITIPKQLREGLPHP